VVALARADIETLHALLKQRKADVGFAVQDRLHRHGLTTHEDAALPNRREDTDDDAAADTATHMDIVSVARNADQLALLEAALARIDAGEYGDCIECGEPIARERLFANPVANRCTDCQQFTERSEKVGRATRI
jgi:DnaK suppressor protein